MTKLAKGTIRFQRGWLAVAALGVAMTAAAVAGVVLLLVLDTRGDQGRDRTVVRELRETVRRSPCSDLTVDECRRKLVTLAYLAEVIDRLPADVRERLRGPRGLRGRQGERGRQGPRGPGGSSGTAGTAGTAGAPGAPGGRGPSGATGSTGQPGSQGPPATAPATPPPVSPPPLTDLPPISACVTVVIAGVCVDG